MTSARSMSRCVQVFLVLVAVAISVTPALAAVTESLGTGGPSADLVARAQARLQYHGYLNPGSYSVGTLDAATTAALERFQADHFIPTTGDLDTDSVALLTTHARLGGGLPAGTTQSESFAGARQRSVPQEEETVTLASRATVQQGSGRAMPETGGSSLPVVAAGAVLLAAGIALLLRRI